MDQTPSPQSLCGTDPSSEPIEHAYDDGYWWCDKGSQRWPSKLDDIWPDPDDRAEFDEGWCSRDSEDR